MLRLRALRSSNDFEAYWKFHEQQEYERTTPHATLKIATTFMGRQLLLVVRAQDDVTGAMTDTRIALSPPRRYSSLDENIRLVDESPSIIGGAPDGATVEGRVFVVPERFAAPASIEEVIAQGGRLVAGVTRSVQKNHAKSISHHH